MAHTEEQERRRPYGRRLVLAYALLVTVTVAGVVVVQAFPNSKTVQRYGPNVVADLFGILVTILLVERLLTWQRERNEAPLRAIALRKVWRQMNRLVYMLLYSYKAAAPAGSETPVALDALLRAWQREARHLDFRRSAGIPGGGRSWHQYAAETMSEFETGVLEVIDRYLSVLGTEFAAAAEAVIDDTVFTIVKLGPSIEAQDAAMGWDLARNSFSVRSVEDPNYDSLVHFADLVRAMHEVYLRLGGPALGLATVFYDDDASPAWDSGRIAD